MTSNFVKGIANVILMSYGTTCRTIFSMHSNNSVHESGLIAYNKCELQAVGIGTTSSNNYFNSGNNTSNNNNLILIAWLHHLTV